LDFVETIRSGFRNYATFSGRATRSEFWYWTLFAVLASAAAGGIGLVLLLIWDCMRGTPGPNRFGPDPLPGVGYVSPPVSA